MALAVFMVAWRKSVDANIPDASSTLLRMHRLYLRQPPHDTGLYDVLQVSPNATAAEISKSYRKLSKRLHPDKQQRNTNDDSAKRELERVRQAYELLKDDRTRLPYHRHGLLDLQDAVYLLTGRGLQSNDPRLRELLRLIGYYAADDDANCSTRRLSQSEEHERRVWFLAANLVELVRPVVEGALSEASLMDHVIQHCDRLKGLPLGAQIVRCVGRAYRYTGRRVLRRHKRKGNARALLLPPTQLLDFQESMRDSLRHAKHVATAAVAGGRVVLEERAAKKTNVARSSVPAISDICWSDGFGAIPGDDDSEHCLIDDEQPPADEEIKLTERRKADAALLESLQVEALWKICKIDLDRTVREACSLILDGEYFFFPSHLTNDAPRSAAAAGSDGWVGSTGIAVTADVGRLRTASILVRMGDIMVQRSKEGTAWME